MEGTYEWLEKRRNVEFGADYSDSDRGVRLLDHCRNKDYTNTRVLGHLHWGLLNSQEH